MFPNEYGLSHEEANSLLKKVGPNILPEKPPPGDLITFLSQLKSPLVYVLLFSSLVTILLGHLSDALIIFLAVFVNTILGFIQERRANKSLFALKKLVTQEAEVIREGKRIKINSSDLVPGDTVVLSQGTKIPADGELIYANRFYLDESIITGESLAIAKKQGNEVLMGTIVYSGQAIMRVKITGAGTRIGGIARDVQGVKEETPLTRQLANFSKKLVSVLLILITFVFAVGIFRGNNLAEMFTTAVALAVSSIPEGLLVSLTVVLAIGMQKILKRRGLVRKLASAETLGGVSVICVDKTGTLTQGKMRVVGVVGDEKEVARQAVLANDLDDPLVIAAFEWGKEGFKDSISKYPRIDSIPFSARDRFFVSLNKWTLDSNMIFVNGAPDTLLEWTNLSSTEKEEVREEIDRLTVQGQRLVGFARKEVSGSKKTLVSNDAKGGLEWIGMMGLSDPVRPSVKEALQLSREAGIRIVVITGDYSKTSEFVLSELGMPVSKKEIILGEDLENLSVEELSRKVMSLKLFARTTPEQKSKIVEALKRNKQVVAMMGDGVNDAPAISRADIGIAVNEASDVAREAADLVLLDSNFATIVAAIEEGRGIFENIRKIILYLLSDAFAEIILVVSGIILGLPLPVTAAQIIWINLISDGLPNLALTIDPKRVGIMKEKPRDPSERLVNGWMLSLIGIVSLVGGLIALLVFVITYKLTGDIVLARSMTFITLGLDSLVYVFSVRSLMIPFWRSPSFGSRWLPVAVLAGFGLQLIPFSLESTRKFFGITSLGVTNWLIAVVLSIVVFFIVEIFKSVYGKSLKEKLV